MTANVVNLRQARKRKARAGKAHKAAENRVLHGRSKAQREAEAAETARARRTLDGARRDDDQGKD